MTLADIKRLTEAATPGPWHPMLMFPREPDTYRGQERTDVRVVATNPPNKSRGDADAAFIAMARTALPKLLAIAEAAQHLDLDYWCSRNPLTRDGCERLRAALEAVA